MKSSIPQRRALPLPAPINPAPKKARGSGFSSTNMLSNANAPWSTIKAVKTLIPKPSNYGSNLSGISSTTSLAERLAQGPAAQSFVQHQTSARGSRFKFKPRESLNEFKTRYESKSSTITGGDFGETMDGGPDHIVFATTLRSVKGGGATSRAVERSPMNDAERRLTSLYRSMD
ncbi:hypothetical protein T439DRAFT_46461 [Meredithblackwellia eburnea MCA 4105]